MSSAGSARGNERGLFSAAFEAANIAVLAPAVTVFIASAADLAHESRVNWKSPARDESRTVASQQAFWALLPLPSWLVAALCFWTVIAGAEGFLHTQGEDVVDARGQKFLLRGVGLGNWLLPEGYMWRFGAKADRPRKIEHLVQELIGPEEARRFWSEFRKNYITQADIERIAALGFNSVRLPLNARLFLTEGDRPAYVDEGFQLLHDLVAWCRQAGIYVIIDMHAAPGGQTGQNIDDSAHDEPELFSEPRNQDRLVGLWVRIATLYKDEPTVAAYDLLNEPLPERTGAAAKYKAQLEPLYRRITAAIRSVDKRHIITLEGADWANDWSVFSAPFDDNLLYQFHYYCWDRPDNLKSISRYLDLRTRLRAPIWGGETGEKDDAIYWGTTDYFEANHVGWGFWPWKKMETRNTPYSIKTPAGWDAIRAYSRGGEDRPSKADALKAFNGLLENIRLENCVFYPDVVNALFHRVPGRVEAENYGHEGFNRSFFVTKPAQHATYYRKSEPVPIQPVEADSRWDSAQAIRLTNGEWTTYAVTSLDGRSLQAVVRAKAAAVPAQFEIRVNDSSQRLTLTPGGWAELKLPPFGFRKGQNRLQLRVESGVVLFDWVEFR